MLTGYMVSRDANKELCNAMSSFLLFFVSSIRVALIFRLSIMLNVGSNTSVQGGFWASSIKIMLFPSPIGYMLCSCSFPLLV